MPIHRLRWRIFNNGLWLTGPRENNPQGTLRRAKSVFPLRTGSIRSRSGSTLISDILQPHSLFKAFGRRIVISATALFREVAGVFTELAIPATIGTLSGARATFLTAPPTTTKDDYVFVVGSGTTKLFKINPDLDTVTQWGIDPPPSSPKPTATAAALKEKEIDDFDATTGWSGSIVDEDDVATGDAPNITQDLGKFVEGTASLRFKVYKDKTTRIDKDFTLDLTTFTGGAASADEDYIELFLAFNKPKHVKNMEIIFYVGAAAPANKDNAGDTYSRELTFANVRSKKRKALRASGDLIRKKDIEQALADGRIDKIDFSLAEFVSEDKIGVTRRTWTRVTLPKASFSANGFAGTAGKTWANVTALRVSVECTKQGGSRVWLDRMRIIGGVGMQGNYQYMFTFLNNTTGSRSAPSPKKTDTNGDIIYDTVEVRNIERTGVNLAGIPAPTDTQVTHFEVWRTVGNGVALFFVDKVASTSAAPVTTYLDEVADYPGMFSGGTGIKFLQPEELPDDNDRPDDTLRDVVGPHVGRIWATRSTVAANIGKVFYSPVGRFEAIANFIRPGSNVEEPQKLVVWNGTLYCFTERAIYKLLNDDEPFVFVEIFGARGTRFSGTVTPTPWGVVYQANDGVRVFDGLQSLLVGDDSLSPIFRGGTSDGLGPFSGVVSTYGRNEYYVSDADDTTLAWSPDGGWRELGVGVNAIFYEDDSGVLLATAKCNAPTRSAIVIRRTSSSVITTTNTNLSLGAEPLAGHSLAQSTVPLACTFTAMYVLLSAAVPGGATVVAKVNVNGTPQAALTVTISAGGSTGNASGTLAIADGDLVSIEFTLTGTASTTVRAVSIAYTVP